MTNAPCTPLSWGEEMELMAAFPKWLEDREEDLARGFFQQFVFFETVDRNTRRCICTSCRRGFFVDKKLYPDFFKKTHGKDCECPNCGQRATLLAMGKYRNFNDLASHERGIQISVHQDWLLLQAGYVIRDFDEEDMIGIIDFMPFRRYAFAPGRRFMWRKYASSWSGEWWTSKEWRRAERVMEPFQALRYEREAAYIPLGVEHLAESSLRYCQYGQWFDAEYGSFVGGLDWDAEPFRVAWLVQYLAEYTRRPQMELLVKLGYKDVVSELVQHKKPNADILDWKAKNPPDFFRLSKQDFKLFQSGVGKFRELKTYRQMHRAGMIRDLEKFVEEKEDCGTDFATICRCCLLAGVSLERGKHYLRTFEGGRDGLDLRTAPQYWMDYLRFAKTLHYDLKRDDVRLPKNLRQRHDTAAELVEIERNKQQMKRYKARLSALQAQFAFAADGLVIQVPESAQEIVDEGANLRHCVGGYAARHIAGKTTILFLRKAKNTLASYVTIEMSTENNCKDLEIVQIHGFQNDRGKRSPLDTHRAFLGTWLGWVRSGSPRDEGGAPVLQNTEEVKTA